MEQLAFQHRLTIEEYLALEKETHTKYEYHNGEVYAMAGGSPTHSLIANNVGASLNLSLKGKSCFVYNSDLRIATSRNKYVYPDVSVVCGKIESFEELKNAANNPVLIVEVLSEETEAYDRGEKFMRYRMIESFKEYVLIEQRFPLVEIFSRNEWNKWEFRTFTDLTSIITLRSVNVEIQLSDIYYGVDFLLFEF